MRRRSMTGLLALLAALLAFPPALLGQGVTRFTGGLKADSMSADIIVPLMIPGTVTNADALEFEAPWDLQVEEVSTRAITVTNPGDGDVTVDVKDDGTSVLSAALSYAAATTTYEQTGMSAVIAKGSVVRIEFALTGTGPALSGVVVALTGRRRIPNP